MAVQPNQAKLKIHTANFREYYFDLRFDKMTEYG